MDILIKSFNRPYYLDRCLTSINRNVSGNYRIKVLDDGTPEKYLQKIKEKFPKIEIIQSRNYPNKVKAIQENLISGKEINGFQIPVDLWISEAKKASDYFIMTEDDVWFTENINLDEVYQQVKDKRIHLLKLGWLGNTSRDNDLIIKKINDAISSAIPKKIFLSNEKVMTAFFFNQYKFYTILYKLGIVDNKTREKYWSLNSILMGLYKKEYWLEIWKNMENKVDEKKQLINASVFYKKHRNNPNFIAKMNTEVMKTTFQSSATNSYHKYGYEFDVNLFNHLINETWYNKSFDSMQNYPQDFSLDYLEKFISGKIDINEFRKWVEQFRKQYRNIGCDVEN